MDNVLRIEVEKCFVGNDVFPDYMISINGSFREGGFAFPYTLDEFSQAELDRVIKARKECESRFYNIPINDIKVKVVKDFRVKTLSNWFSVNEGVDF